MSKAKTKGFGFERDVSYSLMQGGYEVKRTGNDNEAGIDVVATRHGDEYFIECKRYKGFSWNQLVKFFEKTRAIWIEVKGDPVRKRCSYPVLVFKANQQPALVMQNVTTGAPIVETFDTYFQCRFQKRPVGFRFIKEE